MAKKLQEITDAWGSWMNNKYSGGGIRFTESTDYGKHSELNQYHQYETEAIFQSIIYDNGPAPINGSVSSIETDYRNNTSSEQHYTYKESMTTEQSFTWSKTETLSVGVEISATVGVPKVAEINEKVTTYLSFSSTQEKTEKKARTWSIETPMTVKPYTHLSAKLVITTQEYDIKWTATCLLKGYVAIWFNNKVALNSNDPNNKHWLWFYPIDDVFDECAMYNIIDTTGYQIVWGGVLAYSKACLAVAKVLV